MNRLDLLNELYLTKSPSFKETKVSEIVQRELTKKGIPFEVDACEQVYSFQKNTPLLCAHMDQVKNAGFATKLTIADGKIWGNGNLGADDKNGVWILLNLLENWPDISFIFSCGEESGGLVDTLLQVHEKEMASIKYGLIFDRRGSGDIIGTHNDYCTNKFEKAVKRAGSEYGYEPDFGTFSDCDVISEYISCVNLSCGYYHAHTAKEYTVIAELYNALDFGNTVLDRLTRQYAPPEKRWTDWKGYDNYYGYAKYNSYSKYDRIDTFDEMPKKTCYYCYDCTHIFFGHEMTTATSYPVCPKCDSYDVEPVTYEMEDTKYGKQ